MSRPSATSATRRSARGGGAMRFIGACAVVLLVVGGAASASQGTPLRDRRRCSPAQPVTPQGPSAQTQSLGRVNGHEIEAVVYPRPRYPGNPWTQWGQGLVLPDGRFLSAIGDHLGSDGNSYLFVYDPGQHRLTRFTDVLSHVQHADGEWGYGKVHAQIVRGACGQAFVATYWGTDANLRYGPTYQGDQLFRLDTTTLELQPLGVPVPKHGIPTLAGLRAGRLLYGEAPVPTTADATGSTTGAFFAYDPKARKIVFRADDDRLTGFRNVLVGPNGDAYVAAQSSQLLVYDPRANTLRLHSQRLPGGSLRASTEPARDGTVYGVTQDPDRLFALRADGQIDDLGAARGYTASVALDPDGQRFFYVPGAHGDSWEQGTPLLAVDTKTGAQTTVVTLNDLAEEKLGLTLAGSYSVAVDPSGTTVYIGMNAGQDRDEPWGEVVLIVVHLA